MKSLNNEEQAILRIVSRRNGEVGWYGIANSMPQEGVISPRNLPEVLRELVSQGFLKYLQREGYPHGIYEITEQGRAVLGISPTP